MALRDAGTWDRLSDKYRGRLERHGITRERYLSGEPLTGARGHAKTPERPERANKDPSRYTEYLNNRIHIPLYTDKQVTEKIVDLLVPELINGTVERLDVTTIKENVKHMDIATRAKIMGLASDDFRSEASMQVPKKYRKHPELWKRPPSWFYKDAEGHWVNPFWYH